MLIRYNEWISNIVMLLFILHIPLWFLLGPGLSSNILIIMFWIFEMAIPIMLLKRFLVGKIIASLLSIIYVLIGIIKLLFYGINYDSSFYLYILSTLYLLPSLLLLFGIKSNTTSVDNNISYPIQKQNKWFKIAPYIFLSVQLIVSLLIIIYGLLTSGSIEILSQIYISSLSLYLFFKIRANNKNAIRIILILPFCILWEFILLLIVTFLFSNSVEGILLFAFNISMILIPIIILLFIYSLPYYYLYKKKRYTLKDEAIGN